METDGYTTVDNSVTDISICLSNLVYTTSTIKLQYIEFVGGFCWCKLINPINSCRLRYRRQVSLKSAEERLCLLLLRE
jgi:hypothetical protein